MKSPVDYYSLIIELFGALTSQLRRQIAPREQELILSKPAYDNLLEFIRNTRLSEDIRNDTLEIGGFLFKFNVLY